MRAEELTDQEVELQKNMRRGATVEEKRDKNCCDQLLIIPGN